MSELIPGRPVRESTGMRHTSSVLRRAWFPVALVAVVIVALFAFGPLGATTRPASRMSELVPPAALLASPLPSDATATEQLIAVQYSNVSRYPDTVPAYITLGNAYAQLVRETGDPTHYERAEAAFDEALRREPNNDEALIGKGFLALSRHDFRAGLELGQRAVALSPQKARAFGVVVDGQTELGMYEEAIASTQTMVDLRPDLASYSRVSYQRELHGQLDGAIDAMEDALEAGTDNPENTEYIRYLIGNLFLMKGDLDTAEAAYRTSVQAIPEYVWPVTGLARIQAARGDMDAAITAYEGVVERIPLPEFVITLGEMQEAAGRTEDAQATYALVQVIQQLFAANGVNTDLDLALFEADHGTDPAATVDKAQNAYDRQPNIKAADALGWALYRAGRFEEARARAEESLRLGTPYGLWHFHAGMIAKAQGDTVAARTYLSQALETDPYFSPLYGPQAEAALAELGG